MSQHIKILRRVLPHIKFEVALFRSSPRALYVTTSDLISKNWKNRNNNNSGRHSSNISTSPQGQPNTNSNGNACPICKDEYLVLHHPENLDLLKQFNSSPLRNGEILQYSKPELCESKVEGSDSPKENPMPSFEKLQEIEKSLIESLSNLFIRPMDYKVYRSDLLFIDNIRGKKTTTLFHYVQQAALLRAAGHVKFAFVKFIVLNTDISKEEGRITVRWRIVGIGALQVFLQFWKFKLWDWKGLMERQGTWHDGVSYFDVDSNGLIYQHIADKMMVDKDKDVVAKSPKTVLAASLIAAALLLPGSSLQCNSSSSKYSSTKSITPP